MPRGYLLDRTETGTAQTVGTGTAVLASMPAPAAGKVARLEGRALGFDSTNGAAISLARAATIRNVAGTITVAGALDLLAAIGDAALGTAALAFIVNGANIDLRVTGVLTKTIDWAGEITPWTT